jgi:hypothetical protein
VSRLPSHGPSAHTEGCDCVRCTGFPTGNTFSQRHGAYSTLHLGKRAAQLAAEVRDTAPVYEDCDEPTVRLLALTLARVEAATKALDKIDQLATSGTDGIAVYQSELHARLRQDLRGWIHTSVKLAAELGLTPQARGRLGVSVAQIQTERTRRELLERYG